MMKFKLSDDTWGETEYNAIVNVIDSKMFTMGEKVKEFEMKFASYNGSRYAVMVNSGSSANLLAIATLCTRGDLKRGDEVIVPAVSWSTTYCPLQQYGLKLKFVDINIKTLNADINAIEQAISSKTKAIFAVNLLGNPNDYQRLLKICENKKVLLIEDNCEALGGKYNNKFTGTFGLLGTYSTFFSHHISTMEGGLVCTDDEELYHMMLSLRAHGWTRDLPDNTTLYKKQKNMFYEAFNFILPGYNLRPLEIEGAIGVKQLERVPQILKNRRENALLFVKLFSQNASIQIQKEVGESSWFGFSILLKGKLENKRDSIVLLLQQHGIEVRPIVAGNFTKNAVIKYFDYEIFDNLKNSDFLHDNGFFIGNHSRSIVDELKFVYKIISEIVV